jgi:hypothetical protein
MDDTGEVTVSWFHSDDAECPLALPGLAVRVEGDVKVFVRRDGKQGMGVSAKSVEPMDAQQPPPAPPPANPTHTPPQAGSAPQQAEKPVRGQGDALPLAEYQRWWIGRMEWYENSPPIVRAKERGEPVVGVIREAVGAEWMSQSPYDRNIERSPYPEDAKGEGGGQTSPEPSRPSFGFPGRPDDGEWRQEDDDDIPFLLFLAPLLGGLLPWLA